MAIEWSNGFLKRISLGELVGTDWGIRVQDRESWFTLNGTHGCAATDQGCRALANGFARSFELDMAEGRWLLGIEATSWRGTVTVRQRLQSLALSRLSRLALDLLFDRPSFARALTGSQIIRPGDNTCWFHGHIPGVTLTGPKGAAWIRMSNGSDRFKQRIGVRSEAEAWMVFTELAADLWPHTRDPGGFGEQPAAIKPGEMIELTVECELLAAKSEMPAERLGTLQLA